MRTLLVLAATLPCLAVGQARLVVEVGGARAGFATVSHKLMPDGSKVVTLRLQLGKTRMSTETTYAKSGEPVRKFHEVLEPAEERQRVLVDFDSGGAWVTDSRSAAGRVRADLVETGSRANLAEFWFLRDRPKKGDEVRAFNFDLNTRGWDLVTTTYVGPASADVSGKKTPGHELKVNQGGKTSRVIVDDQGLPLLIDQGRVVMRRFTSPPKGS